ncbi:MAG TPA: carboxypeptidase-like regulatory domain-containing protein [Bryobacteraceae bacterium]|nr:carboxypeptidase-like regulatory domain-containing protein [Bryobacteraceae bacterium]
MTSMKLSTVWRVFILAALFAALLAAQSAGTGALTGTVTDPTGAVVPGVTVLLVSLETNQARNAVTGNDGSYKFSLLPPGNYSVRFSASGFKTSEVSSVTVNVTEIPVLDRTLEVGQQSEQVTVEATAELLQTSSSTLGTTVGTKTVTELPLSSRNYTQILALSAGTNTGANNATAFGKGTQDMSVNGNDPGQNSFQMDGVNVNNFANAGSANDSSLYTGIGVPSPDAIQEFKVQTSTYDASYGRNPGANVNVVTKSGSNSFHGTAFEFLRDTIFNANDFFYNRDNPNSSHEKQVLNQNQFGGVLGGPIKRDKLFFFVSYQGTRQKNGVSSSGFTSAFMPPVPAGDRTTPAFKAALGAANCPANHPGDFNFGTFGGPNVACDGSNISQVMLNILNLKLPNGNFYFPGSGTGGYRSISFSDPAIYNEDQVVANFDYLINTKNTLAGRYFYTDNPQDLTLGGELPGAPNILGFSNTDAVLKLTTLVSNTLVNEARISYQRNLSTGNAPHPPSATNEALGITPMTPGVIPPPGIISIAGGYTLLGVFGPTFSVTNQTEFSDQVSWTHGRHTLRFGYEYQATNWPILWSGVRGLLLTGTFNDLLVGGAGNLLSCLYCSRSAPEGIVHGYSSPSMNAYVQDDYKVSNKLTLNLGVRWEYNGALSDKYGNLTQTWVSRIQALPVPPTGPTTSGPGVSQWVVPSNFTHFYGQPPDGVLVNDSDTPERKHAPYSNFGPRIGFAYQATNKLVIRGGAGIFYDRVGADRIIYAVEQGNPYSATVDFGFGNHQTLANPFPSTPTLGTFSSRWANFATGETSNLNVPFLDEILHTPLVRQYNVGVQYQFAPSWVLEVGYVGSSGINLLDEYHNNNTPFLASPSNPIRGITTNTIANIDFRVPYLGYQPVGVRGTAFDGTSNFNSLQITVRKQFSHGFTMQAAYTWSKDLTDLYESVANSNNASDLSQQWGPAVFSRPNRFVVNYSYDLPFGKHEGILGKVAEGWNISGVTIVQDGTPMTIADSGAGTIYGTAGSANQAGFARAEMCPGMTYGNIGTSGGIESRLGGNSGGPGYFNKAAFCGAPIIGDGTGFGDSGSGIILGPGQFNWDMSALKTTRITEQHVLQFRAEFFNAFNHPQFTNPNAGQGAIFSLPDRASGSFGNITSTSVNPRVIQFALKYMF